MSDSSTEAPAIGDISRAPESMRALDGFRFRCRKGVFLVKLVEADTSRLEYTANGTVFDPSLPQTFELQVYETWEEAGVARRALSGQFKDPEEMASYYGINLARHVADLSVTDPDTRGEVEVSVYKDGASGGMFAIDASFLHSLGEMDTITEPFNGLAVHLVDPPEAGLSASVTSIRSGSRIPTISEEQLWSLLEMVASPGAANVDTDALAEALAMAINGDPEERESGIESLRESLDRMVSVQKQPAAG